MPSPDPRRSRCVVLDGRPLVRAVVVELLATDPSLEVTAADPRGPVPADADLYVGPDPARGGRRTLSLEGCDVADPAAALALVHGALRAPAAAAATTPATLSAHERAVLECVAAGLTAAEAAGELGVSRRSVESAKRRVYRKLGARGQADAVRIDHRSRRDAAG